MIDHQNLLFFSKCCEYVIFWLAFFSVIAVCKVMYVVATNQLHDDKLIAKKENPVMEELPGLTFILIHTLCWFVSEKFVSKIMFCYWGPLYLVTVYLVLSKTKVNWKKIAVTSSVACKTFYVVFVGLFCYVGQNLPIYCYSVWIMHDQVLLAWFKNNADRTRRFTEDYFLFRIGYPLFLLLPFFDDNFYCKYMCCTISVLLLIFWIGGIYRLVKKDIFFVQPKIEGFGRDIVYL